MTPALELILSSAGGGRGSVLFGPNQLYRSPDCGPIRSFTLVVLAQAPNGLNGRTHILRAIRALEDVADEHRTSRKRTSFAPRLRSPVATSLRTKFRRRNFGG